MAKKNQIAHKGRIVDITPDFTSVEIVASSACSECHAKGLCGMSEDQEKIIMVPTDPYKVYSVGDEVTVLTKMTMGLKAVWISYVIPLAILLIFLLTLQGLGFAELHAGLAAAVAVCVYYLVVYLFRDKIADKFVFTIAKNNI